MRTEHESLEQPSPLLNVPNVVTYGACEEPIIDDSRVAFPVLLVPGDEVMDCPVCSQAATLVCCDEESETPSDPELGMAQALAGMLPWTPREETPMHQDYEASNTTRPLYVAVVLTKDGVSHKQEGDHACFISYNRDEAVEKALRACDKWTRGSYAAATRGYYVAVGTLTSRAQTPVKYELVSL